jgi:hypothetical protein
MTTKTVTESEIGIAIANLILFAEQSDSLKDIASIGTALNNLTDTYRDRWKELRNEIVNPAPKATAEAKPEIQPSATVADATYTVQTSETKWYTVKIETVETGKFAGKRIAIFLSGPDNETDFTGFAFVNEDGTVSTWKRFRTPEILPYQDALNTVIGHPVAAADFREAYAKVSGRCARCGRKLTVPASLNRGLGPDCAEKMGA